MNDISLYYVLEAESKATKNDYVDPLEYNRQLAFSPLQRSSGSVWLQFSSKGGDGDNYPWKMHIYAKDMEDWKNVAMRIMPYLIESDTTFKTVNLNTPGGGEQILLNKNEEQYGKAFTIYPRDDKHFKEIAIGLDEQLKEKRKNKLRYPDLPLINNNVFDDRHNMGYEKKLGTTNRIFYRLERHPDTFEYVDAVSAKEINPKNPYNPYNAPDPFLGLFKLEKLKNAKEKISDDFVYDKHSVYNPFRVIKFGYAPNPIHVKHSSDGAGESYYYNPTYRGEADILEQMQKVFSDAGVKSDIYFSKKIGDNIIRVATSEVYKFYKNNPQFLISKSHELGNS